jgi:hypothetical protein
MHFGGRRSEIAKQALRRRIGMRITILAKSFYGLFGAVYLLAGVSVLLLSTGLLPQAMKEFIERLGQDNLHTEHIMQEFASLLVFVGLITLWFVRHYDQSWAYHWAMTVFWGLIALVHWFDVRGSFQIGVGQLINTIPFGLFLVVGLLRLQSERRTKAAPQVPLSQ